MDESGDVQPLPVAPPVAGNHQPVLVVAGLILPADRLEGLSHDFLDAKYRFFPGLPYRSENYLDRILPEIKGSDLRHNVLRGSRPQQRHTIGFLDHLMSILETHYVKILARVWIKGLGQPFVGRSIYTSSIQSLCTYFDHYLERSGDYGVCIADSRSHALNVGVSHSVFTQKFRAAPAVYGRLIELPTFGHSDNHAGIQMCDILCSALLYPIASFAYCTGHVANVHVQPRGALLRQRYGQRIRNLLYRYQTPAGRWTGGLVVSDALAQRNASGMFL